MRSQGSLSDLLSMDVLDTRSTVRDCRQVVQDIRTSEFGLDNDPNPAIMAIIDAQQARISRNVHRMIKSTFSHDACIVLQLILNADDNIYSPTTLPTISFNITPTAITVENNEEGFTANNIRALCDVGRSTKIGPTNLEKGGVGFKSVFRITDSPEIHSNGFHILFNANDFIVPQWIEDSVLSTTTTTILLPFKQTVIHEGYQSILQDFMDIQAVVLLFLNVLQKIEVVDETNGGRTLIVKHTATNGDIYLTHNNVSTGWRVHEHSMAGNESSIKIAIPVVEDAMGIDSFVPVFQETFAYMPLQPYGFKFGNQISMILTTSVAC